MGLFAPKPVVVVPVVPPAPAVTVPTVNIATLPTGVRVLTIELPPVKEYTEEDLVRIEQETGSRPVAVCDVTGDLIFKSKNANFLKSERPELQDKVISTKFLRQLFNVEETV
jgi:hypothetical protein